MNEDPIRAELEARRKKGAVLERLGGAGHLASVLTGKGVPHTVRAVMQDAFAAHSYASPSAIESRTAELAEEFNDLGPQDWKRLIGTLLPQVAPSVEAAIDTLACRPYQTGISRRPYRCPRSLATQNWVRGRWLLKSTVLLGEYEADIEWMAERAAHLAGWWGGVEMGWLLAGAIDAGGPEGERVYEKLVAIASGEHTPGEMGRHVTQALMSCARPDAWAFVEKLLLSAQRQEGLRQVILESVDESHPRFFRRMVRLILEEDLTRFSSVVRAADTWFGLMWDGSSSIAIQEVLEKVLRSLDDPAARAQALEDRDPETAYLALWSIAYDDVDAAIEPARALLTAESAAVRFAATHFLVDTWWTSAIPPLAGMLGDPDLRVAVRALDMFFMDRTKSVDGEQLFGSIEQLLKRLPRRVETLDALVWPWWKRKVERPSVAAALATNASAVPSERLLPWVPQLTQIGRAHV